MEVPHERMIVGINRQHSKTANHLASGTSPGTPQARDSKGVPIATLDKRGNRFTTAPVGLVDSRSRNDAMLRLAPCIPKTGFFTHSLRPRVIGTAADFVIFGPMWD